MASGSAGSSRGGRGSASAGARGGSSSSSGARAAEAPSPAADTAPLALQLNPTFVAMPADDLVAHLNRSRRTADFVDAALVLVERERCLAEAVRVLGVCNEDLNKLMETEATLRAKVSQDAETEAALRAEISRAAETEAALRADISQAAETEATLRAEISRAAETEASLRAEISQGAEREAALWTQICTLQARVITRLSSSGLSGDGAGLTQQATGPSREPVLPREFTTASTDGVEGSSHENDATRVQHAVIAQGEFGGGDVPAMKTMHIGARDDTAGHSKVSEEVAQREDMAFSLHRRSKGKQPARATKLLGAAALISSCISGLGLTHHAAGDGVGSSHDAIGVQQTIANEVPTKTSHVRALWSRPAPHLFAATSLMRQGALSSAAPHLTAATLPSKMNIIDDKERATEQAATAQGLNINEEEAQQGNHEVSEDVLTASRDTIAPHKVSEEVAQGEDVAAILPQEKLIASATKKPRSRRHKGTGQLGAGALIWSGISGRSLMMQQAAGHGREVGAQDFATASEDGVGSHDHATDVQSMFAQEEVDDNVHVPMEMSHGELSHTAPPQPVAAPLPDTLIVDDERAMEQVATQVLSGNNEEAQGDREVLEDVLEARVTAGVSEEEAQGKDVATSCHRRPQREEEQHAARATKRARKYKGPCFHNLVLNALKKKEELLKKEEEERLAKEATASASKQVDCRCWLSASYMPSKSAAVEEDPDDGSQN